MGSHNESIDDSEELDMEATQFFESAYVTIGKILGRKSAFQLQENLKIISAEYGAIDTFIDVKEYIEKSRLYPIEDGVFLFVEVNNNNFGGQDPIYGEKKHLVVVYEFENEITNMKINEADYFEIKMSK